MRTNWQRCLYGLCILLMTFIFSLAGLSKLLEPDALVQAVRPVPLFYRIDTDALRNLTLLLGAVEIILSVGMLFAQTRFCATVNLLALLALFIAFLLYVVVSGLPARCSCFSLLLERQINWWSALEDVGIALCGAYILRYERMRQLEATQKA
ncbi:MAG: hypothetical protein RML35_07840 [Chloroherpetonaceae bacterium]|nr:hypothetical protein [Chloroherpetonaceae bacterium]